MLEGLDTIDWSSLTHAHGPAAADVPGLLRSLLSDGAGVRMQACAELHERVWHQGTVIIPPWSRRIGSVKGGRS